MAVLQLSEAGELSYLRSKWWASSCIADKAKTPAVQPQSLKGLFLILAVGLALGTLLSVLELTLKSRRSAAEQRVCVQVCNTECVWDLASTAGGLFFQLKQSILKKGFAKLVKLC